MRARFWTRAALVGGLGLLVSFSASLAPARAIGITAEITALGGDSYRAVYSVHNDGSLGAGIPVLLFDLLFDPSDVLESSLSIVSPAYVSDDWSELLLASAPGVPAAYDALAFGTGIPDGGTASGFAVEFEWLGAGTPGSQAFAIYDATSFALLESGTTVPEPRLLVCLAVLGGVGWIARSGRARRRSRVALSLACLALAAAPGAASATVVGADDIVIENYALVSSLRVSRTEFEYTYAADVANWQGQAIEITASLSSTSPHIVVVEGALGFGGVPAGATRHSADTFTIRLDRQVPFDPGALVWTVATAPVPPTSCALIDAALAAGAIDDETALAYKVFADFGDPRLPADLQGDDSAAREGCGAQEALERFDSLSVATQNLLAPFLVRPEDPESWLRAQSGSLLQAAAAPAPALATAGKKKRKKAKQASRRASSILATATPAADPLDDVLGRVLTRNGKVYVHWRKDLHPDDDGVAQVIADEIDDTIWPKLTGLLGEPKPDDDGVFDVYLESTQALTIMLKEDANGTHGVTQRVGPCNKGDQSTVVYLNRDKLALMPQTAAHEIAHAIQAHFSLASGCEESRWLREANATWVEHFVYPRNDTEHGYASSFLNIPDVSLEKRVGQHEYGAYLWFLYATRNSDANAPAEVRSVFDSLASHDSLGALDAVSRITTGNGLRERWHEFALYNWNRVSEKPVIDLALPVQTRYVGKPYLYYGSWDGVADTARESTGPKPLRLSLGGSVSKTYAVPHRIQHLAAKYFHYDFDPTIRRLRFTHPYANGSEPAVKVQALVKLRDNRGWTEVKDWTRDEKHFLCRDKPEEDFEELIIVISDGEFSNREHVVEDLDGDKTQLKVSALGCHESYVGSADLHMEETTDASSRKETAIAKDVTLTIVKPLTDDDGLDSQSYNVTAGTVAWTHEGRVGECLGKSSGSFSAVPEMTPNPPNLTLGVLLQPVYFVLAFQESAPNPGDYTCPSGFPLGAPIPDYPVWLASPNTFTGSGVLDLPGIGDSGGGTLAGFNNVRTTAGEGNVKTNIWTWFFTGTGTFD